MYTFSRNKVARLLVQLNMQMQFAINFVECLKGIVQSQTLFYLS